MSEIRAERGLFDIPPGIAYLNCAYNSPQLAASREALVQAAGEKGRPWERSPESFFEDAETIRSLAGEILGAESEGFAIVPSASYGISAAARALETMLRPGDDILVMAGEFPSNYLPWTRVARHTGARVLTVPTPGREGWTAAILGALRPGVKIAALSGCHWTNGAPVDLVPIAEACRRHGAALVIDATQTLGAVPFDFSAIEPDFLVAAGYKWLLCPYGVSLCWVAPRWRDARPLEETWLARTNASNFTRLADYAEDYMPGARRFDVGEKGSATLPGAIAALRQLRTWTVEGISRRLCSVNARIAAELERHGFALPPVDQRCPHMFGASLPAGYAGNIVGQLRARHVFVSQRANSLRFAPHLHVDEADLGQLAEALDNLRA